MTFKDLKPGMKVWIREDLEVGALYGSYYFVEKMQKLKCLQTVGELYNKSFSVKDDDVNWCFTNEMVDWEKTERLNNKNSALLYDGTILKGQIDGQEIKVVRSPKDQEDLEKAVMMGLLSSLGYTYNDVKRVQNKVKEVWRPRENEKYYFVTSCGEVVYVYNYDSQLDKELFDFGNFFKTKEEANKKAIEVRKLFNN